MNHTEPGTQKWSAGWVSVRAATITSRCGDQPCEGDWSKPTQPNPS